MLDKHGFLFGNSPRQCLPAPEGTQTSHNVGTRSPHFHLVRPRDGPKSLAAALYLGGAAFWSPPWKSIRLRCLATICYSLWTLYTCCLSSPALAPASMLFPSAATPSVSLPVHTESGWLSWILWHHRLLSRLVTSLPMHERVVQWGAFGCRHNHEGLPAAK